MTRPAAPARGDSGPAIAAGGRPRPRWLPAGLIAAGVALIPWLIALAAELPATATARHWGAAWAGLDAMEAIGLLATGVLLARRDERATLAAMATATLLIADAWLDVMTAPAGPGQVTAEAMAALGELPMAAVCAAVALRRRRTAAPRQRAAGT